MKIWELASGLYTPLSEEENDLLQRFIVSEDIQLSEREEQVAMHLVSRDVLIREEHEENEDRFRVNYKIDVWRD